MGFITNKHNFVFPLFLIGFLLIWNQKFSGALFILTVLIIIGCNDAITHHLLKPYFGRIRPCHNFQDLIVITNCTNNFSFPSNHASNCFTFATLVGLNFPKARLFVFLVAALVGFSRIYLGVHYPLDVFGGVVVGVLMGTLGYHIQKSLLLYFQTKNIKVTHQFTFIKNSINEISSPTR